MKKILWFRRDLRTKDNPLLTIKGEVLPIFIFDKNILSKLPEKDRRMTFLFEKVSLLKANLQKQGLNLKIFLGYPEEILTLLETEGFDEVVASGDYDSYARERDLRVSHILDFKYIHDTYIFKPNEILKSDNTPYLMFTPFFNQAKIIINTSHAKEHQPVKQTLSQTDYDGIFLFEDTKITKLESTLKSIGFVQDGTLRFKDPHTTLKELQNKLPDYLDRDYLDKKVTSDLSLDLRFGTISIREILRHLKGLEKDNIDTHPFFRQLIFRDFYAYLLYHIPSLKSDNFKNSFKGIENKEAFQNFCKGNTGVPIVDAGVRELLHTGKMHNRVRMICASFFTKDLLLPWTWGESFFAKHLLDYDAATNILSWQWSAGTGVDPQPYFRIFNPYLQSKKFDKDCKYIKKWIPELKNINPKLLHNEEYLLSNTFEGYPPPIVKHKDARKKALECFKKGG